MLSISGVLLHVQVQFIGNMRCLYHIYTLTLILDCLDPEIQFDRYKDKNDFLPYNLCPNFFAGFLPQEKKLKSKMKQTGTCLLALK